MDDHLLATLEYQDDGLKEPRLRVEPEPQLAMRPLVSSKGSIHNAKSAA